jgi:hypothetical protein
MYSPIIMTDLMNLTEKLSSSNSASPNCSMSYPTKSVFCTENLPNWFYRYTLVSKGSDVRFYFGVIFLFMLLNPRFRHGCFIVVSELFSFLALFYLVHVIMS